MSALLHHPALCLGLLFGLLLLVNVGYFLRREWEGSHRRVDYAQIYYPTDAPTVRRWRIDGDARMMPEIVWNRTPSQWQLRVNGQPVRNLPGGAPWIDLVGPPFTGAPGQTLEGCRQEYVLRPLPEGFGPDLTFGIVPITRAFYAERGMHFPAAPTLIRTTLPTGNFRRHDVASWSDSYDYLPGESLAEAERIIREEMGIAPADAPLVRMEKIVKHLRTVWAQAGGVPKDDFRWMDPLAVYQEMRAGTGKGWCTQNALVFTFFANRAGVATRFVSGATVQDNRLVYNGHSWAESYLPEHGRWVYVDPQASIVAVFGRQGEPLNSADLFHLCRHDALDGATARIFKDFGWRDLPVEAAPGQALDVPFALVSRVARKEFNEQTIIKYRRPPAVEDVRDLYGMLLKDPTFRWTNLRRYLFEPAPAYSILPTDGNRVYATRLALFGALVLGFGAWIGALFA